MYLKNLKCRSDAWSCVYVYIGGGGGGGDGGGRGLLFFRIDVKGVI
jgi:hypothetical protein